MVYVDNPSHWTYFYTVCIRHIQIIHTINFNSLIKTSWANIVAIYIATHNSLNE